jgi:serine protease Do
MIAERKPGTKVTLDIIRDGRKKKLDFILGNRDDYINLAGSGTTKREDAWLGIRVVGLNSPEAQRFRFEADEGVLVVDVDFDSPADGKIMPGDVIIEINRKTVKNLQDYRKITDKIGDKKEAVLFRVIRNGRKTYEAVKP